MDGDMMENYELDGKYSQQSEIRLSVHPFHKVRTI